MERIGIIGYGNMGAAIAQAIKAKYRLLVFDKDKQKTANLNGIGVAATGADLVRQSEVILLAVKPQDFEHALREIKNCLKDQLIISIAAGISTKHIEKNLGNIRAIRVMPNLGAKIRESVTCLCAGVFATEEDLEFAQQLFYDLGVVHLIPEGLMNAATAICGSGPAYVFDFIEGNSLGQDNIPQHAKEDMVKRLEQAAEAVGFSHEDALFLSFNTVNSSISLLQKSKLPAGELKKQVASKGGTTEKALEVLAKGGSWEEAALAALKRAEELSKGG
ncbi:MAG: pyrroline-5-carboxylate reductase [Candidatus Omnitrophota bacterium]|nr:pyrroline-5-carboxylate reductase [Candidatus Omnitrophota bacterium]